MSERTNRQCIVLLPSGPHYDRLFREILEPVIADAGLAPSRLQQDSSSPIPIDLFVDEIEHAEVLLADVSGNTPEIWIAAGCAMALGKPLCLISSSSGGAAPRNPVPAAYPLSRQRISQRLHPASTKHRRPPVSHPRSPKFRSSESRFPVFRCPDFRSPVSRS